MKMIGTSYEAQPKEYHEVRFPQVEQRIVIFIEMVTHLLSTKDEERCVSIIVETT